MGRAGKKPAAGQTRRSNGGQSRPASAATGRPSSVAAAAGAGAAAGPGRSKPSYAPHAPAAGSSDPYYHDDDQYLGDHHQHQHQHHHAVFGMPEQPSAAAQTAAAAIAAASAKYAGGAGVAGAAGMMDGSGIVIDWDVPPPAAAGAGGTSLDATAGGSFAGRSKLVSRGPDPAAERSGVAAAGNDVGIVGGGLRHRLDGLVGAMGRLSNDHLVLQVSKRTSARVSRGHQSAQRLAPRLLCFSRTF